MGYQPHSHSAGREHGSVNQSFHALLSYLSKLSQQISRGAGDVKGFERAGGLLATLPLTTDDFSVSTRRLANAEQYHAAGEVGAATFELKLLTRRIETLADLLGSLEPEWSHVPSRSIQPENL